MNCCAIQDAAQDGMAQEDVQSAARYVVDGCGEKRDEEVEEETCRRGLFSSLKRGPAECAAAGDGLEQLLEADTLSANQG